MREILFRGKRKDNGEWIEGYLLIGRPYSCDNDEVNIVPPTDPMFFPRCEIGMHYDVDPETVGQYTGLKDKNGKKVFEGDILSQTDRHCNNPLIRAVKYEMSCGSCCTQVFGFGASGQYHLDFINLTEPFEVIGNIHDNPELLEVK